MNKEKRIVEELYCVYETTPREIAEGIYGAGYRKIDEPMKEAQK